jgi:hypothetical protein
MSTGAQFFRKTVRWSILLTAALFMEAVMPAATPSPGKESPHTVTITSSRSLQLAPTGDKEWYEQGLWPLAGAVGALIITNAVSVWIVYMQAARSFNAVLRQRKIELLSAALSEFYNPLLALIDINGEIFAKTGPPSFPRDEPGRSAAGLVWKETKKKILANNVDVERILRTKSHLLQGADTLEAYHPLLVHVAMYETFQAVATDLYKAFFFPSGIRDHIVQQRSAVLEAFYEASGEQI